MTHQLKCWHGAFDAIANGSKKHEVRKADRDYKVGDTLILREFTPQVTETGVVLDQDGHTVGKFTGQSVMRKITYISVPGAFGLPKDLCVLSLGDGA
jgi:Domain of unknown function (DUF3850)